MIRVLMLMTIATAAVMTLVRKSPGMAMSRRRVVPATVAAERLRQAWADHHTVA